MGGEKEPVRIAMYSDVHCPYAYLSAYRVQKIRAEYRGRVIVECKSLALEYINKQPTPKYILDSETPFLMREEPDIPYRPWHRPVSEWPVTMWPAFEAIKCAERQSWELASDLDWAIRVAFFAESRCISLRHIVFELAAGVGLNMQQFSDDFDHGITKYRVLQEAQEGWEQLKVQGSPTFVLPSGKHFFIPGLPKIELDKNNYFRVTHIRPAPCNGQDCLDIYRQMFDEALSDPKHHFSPIKVTQDR